MHPTRFLTRAFAGAAIVSLSFGAAGAADKTISGINFAPDHVFYGKPLVEFAAIVNKNDKGLKLDLKPYGSIGMFEIGNAVKNGVVDLANLPPTFMTNVVPIAEVIKLTRDSEADLGKKGVWTLLNQAMNEQGNMQLIKAWGQGVNFHIYLREKKIDKPDLSGLKMRAVPAYSAGFAALGATPVNMPFNELYTALERKVIDGYGITLSDIVTWGWSKFTKYRVDPGFYEVWSLFLMNKNTWDGLSQEHKDVIMAAANEIHEIVEKRVPEQNAKDIQEQKDAKMEVITFTGDNAKKLREIMYDTGWKEALKKDPKYAPQFQKLFGM
jgi:TRAP-type C4-dicarboxylate transport system substrate-binding protein